MCLEGKVLVHIHTQVTSFWEVFNAFDIIIKRSGVCNDLLVLLYSLFGNLGVGVGCGTVGKSGGVEVAGLN